MTTTKYLTIPLSGRRPVKIEEDQWPWIAGGSWDQHDGQVECQANRKHTMYIRVRATLAEAARAAIARAGG